MHVKGVTVFLFLPRLSCWTNIEEFSHLGQNLIQERVFFSSACVTKCVTVTWCHHLCASAAPGLFTPELDSARTTRLVHVMCDLVQLSCED